MSILIKGMDIPKKCTVCNFGDALMGKGFCYVSHCKQIENYFVRNDRPSWCPLIEIPDVYIDMSKAFMTELANKVCIKGGEDGRT